jgi:hypothetical protein
MLWADRSFQIVRIERQNNVGRSLEGVRAIYRKGEQVNEQEIRDAWTREDEVVKLRDKLRDERERNAELVAVLERIAKFTGSEEAIIARATLERSSNASKAKN